MLHGPSCVASAAEAWLIRAGPNDSSCNQNTPIVDFSTCSTGSSSSSGGSSSGGNNGGSSNGGGGEPRCTQFQQWLKDFFGYDVRCRD